MSIPLQRVAVERAPTLRIVAAQASAVAGDVEANVATAVDLVRRAADQGARVVVLPEAFLTGYDVMTFERAVRVRLDDPRLRPLVDAAPDVTVLVGTIFEHVDGRATLATLEIRNGLALHAYDKQHLTSVESQFFLVGERSGVVEVDGWRLGLGICYDGVFPEHAVEAAAGGADVYVCSIAYFAGSEHRRDLAFAARALDNGIYCVVSGLTGRCGTEEFSGGSAVYDPEGRVVERVGADDPALVVADLAHAEIERVQADLPVARDRARLGVSEADAERRRLAALAL